MFHIFPRLPHQPFVEPPFEEEILAFLCFLRHGGAIRKLTDVNINKLHQPWRSFASIINKCLTGKSSSYDSLRWNTKIQRRAMRCIILGSQRDDHMFTMIKMVPRHRNTQQFGALLPIELTNEDIKNSNAYKEYYAFATGATPTKPKASVWKTRSSSDTTITPPTAAAGPRLTTFEKGKQAAKASKAKNKRTGSIPGVLDVPTDEYEEEISWNSTDEEGDDDEGKDGDGDDGEEGDDDDQEDEGNDEDDEEEDSNDEQASNEEEFIHPSLSTHAEEETRDEESFYPIPKTPENIDDEGNGEENLGTNVGREEGHDEEEEEDKIYRDVNINLGRGIQLGDVHTTQEVKDSHVTLTSTLKANFSEFMQTNQFAGAVSSIPRIVHRYMDQRMNEAVQVAVQIQSDRLYNEAQAENDKFLKTINENMLKIIKEQVKEQVKTSYAVAADLSKMELKKILIEKIEGNKSIQRSNEQRNLYKALIEAYESDKIILDTYEDTVTLKRRRDDDADKDEEPSDGSDRGSKRRREGKEHESASAPKEKATRSAGKSTHGSKSRQTSKSESAIVEEPMHTTFEMEEPSHPEFETGADDQPIVESSQHPEWFSQQKKPPTPDRDWNKTLSATHESIQPWISKLAKQSDSRSYFNELMDTPVDFSNFLMNWLKVDTLTPELLAGPTYELMKGSCKILVELEFFLEEVYKATTDQLDWVNLEGQQYPHNLLKPLPLIPNNRGRHVIPFDHFINNDLEYLCGGKLANLTVEERFAFNISLRMFTRSIVIQRRVEDLQLGVESYQKKLNLTKPNTYRSDLKRKEAYIADRTLTDVRTALDDRLNGIRMKYMPQSIWSKSDKDRAAAMIQAIDKRLKTRRIMRSLERSKSEYMGIVPTEMELILEHTQQGISHEVSISAEEVEE
nr:hypothetical protein [Tanacetum cinerariifolium]